MTARPSPEKQVFATSPKATQTLWTRTSPSMAARQPQRSQTSAASVSRSSSSRHSVDFSARERPTQRTLSSVSTPACEMQIYQDQLLGQAEQAVRDRYPEMWDGDDAMVAEDDTKKLRQIVDDWKACRAGYAKLLAPTQSAT
jgi:hypothetical protein